MSDWTDEEEKAFAYIMQAGKLGRLPAIRLYRRAKGRLEFAINLAKDGLEQRLPHLHKAVRSARSRRIKTI